MASGISPAKVAAIAARHGTDPVALAAAMNEEFARRSAERRARREERLANPAPSPANRYRAIRNGSYTPQRRPRSSGEDRQFVGGALRHWRTVHGLSQRQAQQRIGYAASAQTWHMWETNISAPPYRALLKIISATGLGHVDDTRRDADLELDALATKTRERLRARRLERERERNARADAAIAGQ